MVPRRSLLHLIHPRNINYPESLPIKSTNKPESVRQSIRRCQILYTSPIRFTRAGNRLHKHIHPSSGSPINTSIRLRVHSNLGDFSTYLVIVAAVVSTALLIEQDLRQDRDQSLDQTIQFTREEEVKAMMAGKAPPGRPGNLTEEQEKKLQELWTALLHTFGILEPAKPDGSDGADPQQSDQRSQSIVAGSGKKNKSRLNLFGRNKHDDPVVSQSNTNASMDGEDKYGQAKEFEKIIQSRSKEELREALWTMVKHDDPDALLLRFLRARKWHVQNALIMLIATVHWRLQDMHLDDDIIQRGEAGALADSKSGDAKIRAAGEDFLRQIRMGKSFLHGCDNEGRPMCFVRVKLHRQHDQGEASLERYTVYTIETARLLLSSNVDTAAVIFDMTDFSLANMDYSPVKFMIKVFEANYPESLGVVLVHKSPWVFNSIWKLIRGWLDPVVASKIHFTQNLTEFEQYVPKSHIPKELGGDDQWEYQYIEPRSDENNLMDDVATRQRLQDERAAVVKEYEQVTQQWIQEPARDGVIEKRVELMEKLRVGYWQLDPYVRARTLYDRTGMIQNGKIHYYGEQQSTIAASNGIPTAVHSANDVD